MERLPSMMWLQKRAKGPRWDWVSPDNNVKCTHKEFPFICLSFIPSGTRVNVADYEGGPPEDTNTGNSHFNSAPPTAAAGLGKITNSLCIKIPIVTQQMAFQTTTKQSQSVGKENDINEKQTWQCTDHNQGSWIHTLSQHQPPNWDTIWGQQNCWKSGGAWQQERWGNRKPTYLLSCQLLWGYCKHDGMALLCPSGNSKICGTRSQSNQTMGSSENIQFLYQAWTTRGLGLPFGKLVSKG